MTTPVVALGLHDFQPSEHFVSEEFQVHLLLRVRGLAVVGLAAVLIGGSPGAASAEHAQFRDKHGEVSNGLDIQRVSVANKSNWLILRSKHRNITKRSTGGMGYYIDTEKSNRGPEFVVGGGTSGAGADYSISRVHGFNEFGYGPLACPLRFHVAYKRDVVRFGISKQCLKGHLGRLRVNAVSSFGRNGKDWAPSRHEYYRWVDRS